jgi:MFS family permease
MVPYIRSEFAVQLSTIGQLLGLFGVAYALFQLPGGLVADALGERRVFTISFGLGATGLALCTLAQSMLVLALGVLVLGVAVGLYATTRFTVLSDIYPDQAGTAIGVSNSLGNVGSVLVPLVAVWMAETVHWRAGFGWAVPLFLVGLVGFRRLVPVRTSPAGDGRTGPSSVSVRRVLGAVRRRRTLGFAVTMFLMEFVFQGFTGFYPTYLTNGKHLPQNTAALFYSVVFGTGVLIQPLAGASTRLFGERRSIVAFTVVPALGLVSASVVEGYWGLFGVSIMLGIQFGFWPIAQAGIADSVPSAIQGSGVGLIRTVSLLLAASAPVLLGALATVSSLALGFTLLGACGFVAVIVSLVLLDD